jgi:hypothetical protein
MEPNMAERSGRKTPKSKGADPTLSSSPPPPVSPLAGSTGASGWHAAMLPPFASGWHAAGAFWVDYEVEQVTATAFQLAPRLFILTRAAQGEPAQSFSAQPQPSGPLDELPPHLSFRECVTDDLPVRQQWISDDVGSWRWELIVEHDRSGVRQGELAVEAMVTAILTASLASQLAEEQRYVWKARAGWDPFGTNLFEPDHSGSHAELLMIAAP